jgi:plasmid stability protein
MKYIRSTFYLEENLHRALKVKAALLHTSISKFINEIVKRAIKEDIQDLKAFKEREREKEIPLEVFIEELKKDGLL